jgi:hypothetical protein
MVDPVPKIDHRELLKMLAFMLIPSSLSPDAAIPDSDIRKIAHDERADDKEQSPPAKSTQVLTRRPEQKMQSDVVSSHTIKSFHQPLEIEGKIQKHIILKNT